jgi:excisionase family DNA binding protein
MARNGVLKQAVHVRPGADQARSASELVDAIDNSPDAAVVLAFADGRQVPVSEALLGLMRASAKELAEGNAVTVLPAEAVLTPNEVGELLGLSRPFVVRLLDDGTIPSERLPGSRHRRIRLIDVLAFAEQRDRRREGRQRIADAITDADLPY